MKKIILFILFFAGLAAAEERAIACTSFEVVNGLNKCTVEGIDDESYFGGAATSETDLLNFTQLIAPDSSVYPIFNAVLELDKSHLNFPTIVVFHGLHSLALLNSTLNTSTLSIGGVGKLASINLSNSIVNATGGVIFNSSVVGMQDSIVVAGGNVLVFADFINGVNSGFIGSKGGVGIQSTAIDSRIALAPGGIIGKSIAIDAPNSFVGITSLIGYDYVFVNAKDIVVADVFSLGLVSIAASHDLTQLQKTNMLDFNLDNANIGGKLVSLLGLNTVSIAGNVQAASLPTQQGFGRVVISAGKQVSVFGSSKIRAQNTPTQAEQPLSLDETRSAISILSPGGLVAIAGDVNATKKTGFPMYNSIYIEAASLLLADNQNFKLRASDRITIKSSSVSITPSVTLLENDQCIGASAAPVSGLIGAGSSDFANIDIFQGIGSAISTFVNLTDFGDFGGFAGGGIPDASGPGSTTCDIAANKSGNLIGPRKRIEFMTCTPSGLSSPFNNYYVPTPEYCKKPVSINVYGYLTNPGGQPYVTGSARVNKVKRIPNNENILDQNGNQVSATYNDVFQNGFFSFTLPEVQVQPGIYHVNVTFSSQSTFTCGAGQCGDRIVVATVPPG